MAWSCCPPFATFGCCGAAEAQDWQWSFTPYVWAAEVGADVSINDHEVLEREADLADVLDSLDFIAAGALSKDRTAATACSSTARTSTSATTITASSSTVAARW